MDVEFPVTRPPAMTVPADAILDSGLRKTVFVDRGNGFFEPRQVETGWRLGNRVEITKGLEEGERIVISGNFLIDSESRLQAAGQGIYGAMSVDPVCGMEVDEAQSKGHWEDSSISGQDILFLRRRMQRSIRQESGALSHGAPSKRKVNEPHPSRNRS